MKIRPDTAKLTVAFFSQILRGKSAYNSRQYTSKTEARTTNLIVASRRAACMEMSECQWLEAQMSCCCRSKHVARRDEVSCSGFIPSYVLVKGPRWRSWLRHCATSQKVAGSIPDCVTAIFHWHNPSGRTVATGVDSASNRNEYREYFLGVKAAGA